MSLESLPEERYLALLKNLIVRRAVSGKEEIVVPKSQKKLFTQDFIDSLSSAFPGKGSFTVASENGDFTWGVVMREGRRVVDLTLRVLFEQLKEKVEPEIAALLFPEE